MAGQVGGHAAAQLGDAGLGRAVGRDRLARELRLDRGDVDDLSGAALDHSGRDEARDVEDAGEVSRDERVPVGDRELGEGRTTLQARVVDEDVGHADALDQFGDAGLDRGGVGDVEDHELGAGAVVALDRVGGLLQGAGVAAVDDQARSCVSEGEREAAPESARGSGDEGELAAEGERVSADTKLCVITGPARPILSGERSALNFLQFLSAVASCAAEYSEAIAHTNAKILDTRKTIPGLRLAQKYAVTVGGASNHRVGLYDAILIKENHIVAAGTIAKAVAAARAQNPGVICEVEVENLAEAEAGMRAEADRLLLDNFTHTQLKEAVKLRNEIAPMISLEASGGVDLTTAKEIAECLVDFISVGKLTKDISAVDLSMRFKLLEEE